MRSTAPPTPRIEVLRPDYEVPVINERAVRAGAGILFLGGAIAFGLSLANDTTAPLQPFGMLFMIDILLHSGSPLPYAGYASHCCS